MASRVGGWGIGQAVLALTLATVVLFGVPAAAARPASGRATSPGCLIDVTYRIFLSRSPTEEETAAWTAHLEGGGDPTALPEQLSRSDEWLGLAVSAIYHQALDRTPDAAGLAFWADQIRGGVPLTRVATHVYGSDEFYVRAGGTDAAYIAQLYLRIFDRPGDPAGIAYWTDQLQRRPRASVATVFFGSAESRGNRVDGLYLYLLGRLPDSSGRQFWIDQLTFVDDVEVAIHLAAGEEFAHRAEALCAPLPLERITDGNDRSDSPAVSDDGNTVVFSSEASNLVPRDTNGQTDVFLHDLVSGTTTRLTNGNGGSTDAAVSADGMTVVYSSEASNLVPGDINVETDIFLWDRATRATIRLTAGESSSLQPAISDDGRSVTYWSNVDSNLDVFLWDRTTGVTTRVTRGNGSFAMDPSISGDGTTVAFASDSTNLVPGDTNDAIDVFTWNRSTRRTTRISDGDGDSMHAVLSEDGGAVAYFSWATDLVAGDTDERSDVFLWSRATGTTTLVTDGPGEFGYSPAISDDAQTVAFDSLPVMDGEDGDVFAWDRATGDVTTIASGDGPSHASAISADGGLIAFASDATDLVADDTNGFADIFVRHR